MEPDIFDTVPVEAMEDLGVDPCCQKCNARLMYYGNYDNGDGSYYCDACATAFIKEWEDKAWDYAVEACKITEPLPEYDHSCEYRCTPEEYEAGDRESHSPGSYAAFCRHNCTNYDDLIKPLSRYSAEDRVMYAAIRERTMEMLESHPDFMREPERPAIPGSRPGAGAEKEGEEMSDKLKMSENDSENEIELCSCYLEAADRYGDATDAREEQEHLRVYYKAEKELMALWGLAEDRPVSDHAVDEWIDAMQSDGGMRESWGTTPRCRNLAGPVASARSFVCPGEG
jgi:hypothetical protein